MQDVCFLDKAHGKDNYSQPILEVQIKEALKTIDYDLDKFLDHGRVYNWETNKNEDI
ncbi:hypothetical protein [Winogradskyella sp. PC D3.3]